MAIYQQIALGLALAFGFASPAFAQAAQPAPANSATGAQPAGPAGAEPQATTATFGNWILRCQEVGGGKPKVCEISQSIQLQNQSGPAAQYGIAATDQKDEWILVAVLPPNVSFPSSVKFVAGSKADKSELTVELNWRRCLPGGCFAEARLSHSVLNKISQIAEPGQMNFQNAAGASVGTPIYFSGLSQAMQAFIKR